MALLLVGSAVSVYGTIDFRKGAYVSRDIVPTFHKGFSAGLRPAPTQCVTDVLVGFNDLDFSRKVREECESRNYRKKFCVDYCVNRAERERRAAKSVSLVEVPNMACNSPPKNTFGSKDECLKSRLKHCTVNCKRGREQSLCSRSALIGCVRADRALYTLTR